MNNNFSHGRDSQYGNQALNSENQLREKEYSTSKKKSSFT